MTAGAVLSGSYFGDKISPMSDTTNLAPAMAGTDLFTHIRYMLYTTTPTIIITLIAFIIIGLNLETKGVADTHTLVEALEKSINVSPWLFIVPILVIFLIVKKTSPIIALLIGTLLGAIAALIFNRTLYRLLEVVKL
jgi:NhaC family Na+:H+ antiporter